MYNNMPNIPNMPFPPFKEENAYLKKELDSIYNKLIDIEKLLSNINNKNDNNSKGIYML